MTFLYPPSQPRLENLFRICHLLVCDAVQAADAQEAVMLDVVMLGLGLGFFVVSVGYAYACERL